MENRKIEIDLDTGILRNISERKTVTMHLGTGAGKTEHLNLILDYAKQENIEVAIYHTSEMGIDLPKYISQVHKEPTLIFDEPKVMETNRRNRLALFGYAAFSLAFPMSAIKVTPAPRWDNLFPILADNDYSSARRRKMSSQTFDHAAYKQQRKKRKTRQRLTKASRRNNR